MKDYSDCIKFTGTGDNRLIGINHEVYDKLTSDEQCEALRAIYYSFVRLDMKKSIKTMGVEELFASIQKWLTDKTFTIPSSIPTTTDYHGLVVHKRRKKL